MRQVEGSLCWNGDTGITSNCTYPCEQRALATFMIRSSLLDPRRRPLHSISSISPTAARYKPSVIPTSDVEAELADFLSSLTKKVYQTQNPAIAISKF